MIWHHSDQRDEQQASTGCPHNQVKSCVGEIFDGRAYSYTATTEYLVLLYVKIRRFNFALPSIFFIFLRGTPVSYLYNMYTRIYDMVVHMYGVRNTNTS